MNSDGYSDADPFSFFEEEKLPSWYEQLIWDLHEFMIKSFGLDPMVWMGRIVVSLVLMFAWDAYWAPESNKNRNRERQQHQEPTNEETGNTVDDATESLEKPSQQPQSLPVPSSSPQSSESKDEIETKVSIPKETNIATTKEPTAQVSKNASKIDKPKGTATTTSTAPSTISRPNYNSNFNPWAARLDGFHYWYEVETSLYRIYTLAHRDPSVPTIPPYLANSQRGNVAVEMNVTNRTHRDINVYWVDYKGKRVPKGRISKRSGVWTQTTWIDHRTFSCGFSRNRFLPTLCFAFFLHHSLFFLVNQPGISKMPIRERYFFTLSRTRSFLRCSSLPRWEAMGGPVSLPLMS